MDEEYSRPPDFVYRPMIIKIPDEILCPSRPRFVAGSPSLLAPIMNLYSDESVPPGQPHTPPLEKKLERDLRDLKRPEGGCVGAVLVLQLFALAIAAGLGLLAMTLASILSWAQG
jgi:hypothetical protein